MYSFSFTKRSAACLVLTGSLFTGGAWAQAPETPAAPGQPDTSAPDATATDDLSKFKTADDLYSHSNDLRKALHGVMQTEGQAGIDHAKAYITKLKAALLEFISRYQSDSRAWKSKLELLHLRSFELQITDGDPATLEKDYQALADDPAAPKEIATGAYMEVVGPKVMALLNGDAPTDETWNSVDKIIADVRKKLGDKPAASEVVVNLLNGELRAMIDAKANDQFKALVAKLKKDPNPDVVAAAKSAEQMKTTRDEIFTKPMDLKYTAVDGTKVDLTKWRGKVVLIDFWATWCGPCMAEMPDVIATYKKFHDQGFEIAGVSLDQDKDALLQCTKENEMAWPQYFDGTGWDNAISRPLGIQSIPAMWLLNKKGMLVTMDGSDDLASQVEKLLKE